jgi:hypothetical protein
VTLEGVLLCHQAPGQDLGLQAELQDQEDRVLQRRRESPSSQPWAASEASLAAKKGIIPLFAAAERPKGIRCCKEGDNPPVRSNKRTEGHSLLQRRG